jgi:hypothetical protein
MESNHKGIDQKIKDKFACDIYNQTFGVIRDFGPVGVATILLCAKNDVSNAELFTDYELANKIDLVLNNLIRGKQIELSTNLNETVSFCELTS